MMACNANRNEHEGKSIGKPALQPDHLRGKHKIIRRKSVKGNREKKVVDALVVTC